MNKATENINVSRRNPVLFKISQSKPKYRSKSSYASAKYSNVHSMNEDERGFLRQVLVSSGMGKGKMLALLG